MINAGNDVGSHAGSLGCARFAAVFRNAQMVHPYGIQRKCSLQNLNQENREVNQMKIWQASPPARKIKAPSLKDKVSVSTLC